MKRIPKVIFFILPALLNVLPPVLPQDYKILKTVYSTVHYSDDGMLRDFMWRVGGLRLAECADTALAESRIDRIVERVERVLDMYPKDFHVDIYLYSGYEEGEIAFYSEDTASITVYVDRVTDGVLAHEISHAVMYEYFEVPPPRKVQEILARYADLHLWQDY